MGLRKVRPNCTTFKDDKIIIVQILFNNGCFQNSNQMLKYVNPDFQISDLKQVIWLSLYATQK